MTETHETRAHATGVALMSVSVTCMPFGQAAAARAVDAMSAPGVVAIRQLVTALVLVPVARPRLRSLTRQQLAPAVLLGVVFVAMNLCLLSSIHRIGVALAVTLEFLGPLAVALVSSGSRRDLALAVTAGLGVYVLVLPGPSSDLLGVGLALGAAGGWATYIHVNRTLGERLPGLEGTAVASLVSTAICLPLLAWLVVTGRAFHPEIGFALVAGVLCSVVPYGADLLALRRVPRQVYSVFMSLNLVTAAVAGLVVLGQGLTAHELVGIAVIVGVNAVSTLAGRRVERPQRVTVSDAESVAVESLPA
ncbi:EamA family transporter [Nocardioides mangrovi]|uniref:EamA family transporter n=1 Tax=Nocardioides mangrovi TaxID=2874580 RepID=A0ABS7U6I4_9ACTN|nr:EamA family transporter [Nocardioides mangrovi]MBZ5736564.1 EamA family transporter [Nocardioides mangrovi]